MAILNQKKILNLIPKVSAPVTIHVSQGDVGTEIEFTLVKGDEVFVNPGNVTASVHGVREDGANFGPFTCTLSNSKVTFPLHSEMTAVKGSALAEIVLVNNSGNKIGSANFGILVEESVFPLGVTYDNDVSVYESILAYAQSSAAQITDSLSDEISARISADALISTRIDQIVAPTGEAPNPAEITDARIGADGVTYDSLGNATRTQFTNMRNTLITNTSITRFPQVLKGFIINYSNAKWQANANSIVMIIPIKEGDEVYLERKINVAFRYAVLKSLGEIKNGLKPIYATGYTSSVILGQFEPYKLTVPADANYLLIPIIWEDGSKVKPRACVVNGFDYSTQEVIDEVVNLRELVLDEKPYDIFSIASKFSRSNAAGLTYTYDEATDSYTVNGTLNASESFFTLITNYQNYEYPGFIPGETYYLEYSGAKVRCGLYCFNSNGDTTFLVNSLSSQYFTIPEDSVCYKLVLRVVTEGTVVSNETVPVPKAYRVNTTIKKLNKLVEDDKVDVALGGTSEYIGTDEAGLYHVPYKTLNVRKNPLTGYKQIVVINHDDLELNDCVGTRKIYNKFGHRSNFNFILKPFANVTEMEEKCKEVRKLILDGNDIGLHAILGTSFLMMNKMFDVRPGNDSSFGPSLSELTTDVGNSKNIFGMSLNDTVGTCGYFPNAPYDLQSVKIGELTAIQRIQLIANYTLWDGLAYTYTGLNLNNQQVTLNALSWVEYWYNELIDNSLGYSNNSVYYADNFWKNYEVPSGTPQTPEAYESYYPTAQNILSGHYVFFDDYTNPHYSDYQKVGRFRKGLFKGCATTCNFEIIDRCIEVAKAFCRHYFGFDDFTQYSRHGVRYAKINWKSGKYLYDNSGCDILSGDSGKVFSLRLNKIVSERDIFLNHGIKNTMHAPDGRDYITRPAIYGEAGFYKGQHNVRYPFFGKMDSRSGMLGYLSLMGNQTSFANDSESWETINSFIRDVNNLPKWAFEKAGTAVTNSESVTKYVHKAIRACLLAINGTIGTGKIPCISVDTNTDNASFSAAIHCLSQYCYDNGIKLVPMEEGRMIAEADDRNQDNYFANPVFNQSLLNYFGGVSTSPLAYLPDGWVIDSSDNISGSVNQITVSTENNLRILTVAPESDITLSQSDWGLPAGTYKFKVYAKKNSGSPTIKVRACKNKDTYMPLPSVLETITPTSEFVEYEVDFTIPEFYRNPENLNDDDNIVASGYEDNICCILISLGVSSGASLSIHSPSIRRV